MAPARGGRKVFGPVGRDAALCGIQGNAAGFYFGSEIVLDAILLFKVPLIESHCIRPTLGPDISHPIRATKFERHQVVKFTDLLLVGVDPGLLNVIPTVGDVFLRLTGLTIADGASSPVGIAQNVNRNRGIDSARRALRIGYRVIVFDTHMARCVFRLLPCGEVFGTARDIGTYTEFMFLFLCSFSVAPLMRQ